MLDDNKCFKPRLFGGCNIKNKMENNNNANLDQICEECKKKDDSVSQNLIMYGYKICESCRLSKTIFPF